MKSVDLIDQWPVKNTSTAVISASGKILAEHGDSNHEFALASVTKLLTAFTALIALEEGVVELDTPAGPDGSTIRHLLSHTSGLAFNEHKVVAEPGNRRLYSNTGFEVLAATLAEHSEIDFVEYQSEALFKPLNLAQTRLLGSPASGGVSTTADLAIFATELQQPTLISPETLTAATKVVFPGLTGVLPGYGHQKPNDWGLGFEIKDHKSPHWTGSLNSAGTFGHFGQAGGFLWVDPVAKAACVTLTDRDFGQWAVDAWPGFTNEILREISGK